MYTPHAPETPVHFSVSPLTAKGKTQDARTAAEWERIASAHASGPECQPAGSGIGTSNCGVLQPFAPNSWLPQDCWLVETGKYSVGGCFIIYTDPSQPAPADYLAQQDAAEIAFARAVLARLY